MIAGDIMLENFNKKGYNSYEGMGGVDATCAKRATQGYEARIQLQERCTVQNAVCKTSTPAKAAYRRFA